MDISFRLYYEDRIVCVSEKELTKVSNENGFVYRGCVNGARVEWRFELYNGGALVDLKLEGGSGLGICRVDSIVFETRVLKKTDRVLFMGRSINDEMRYPFELGVDSEYCSSCVGFSENISSEGVLVASVAPHANVCGGVIRKKEDGRLDICAKTEYVDSMKSALRIDAEQVYVSFDNIDRFLENYRSLLPKSSFDMPKLKGWNTWDYYLDRVRPEDIFENVEALKKMPFAHEIDYIVIDDGWQADWGVWRENEKFDCGLKAVADNITQAGFIPGIWMAPISTKKDSDLLLSHPDWFCRTADGELLLDMGLYYLDPTHPEVEKFILDNYKYQYDAGFRLFKMDYISPLLKIKSFYDKKSTPYEVLSRLVSKVKECTGEDAVVLGCSLPLECGADIAPSMRIGIDIHNHFSHVECIAQCLAWSWMYNLKNTRIDPDFLVVRGEETANEPLIWEGDKRNDFVPPPRFRQTDRDRFKKCWRHGDQFNALEAETWASLVTISGGNIFLSDRMSVLNERGISIIENALLLAGDSIRPKYMKDDVRLPSIWYGDRGILLVNWSDVPRTLTVSGIDGELESSKEYTLENGNLTVSLLPHESFGGRYKNR